MKNKDEKPTKEERRARDAEKEDQEPSKQVQEKLIKFATRIPIFMYLTDYREQTLKDVINEAGAGTVQEGHGTDQGRLRAAIEA